MGDLPSCIDRHAALKIIMKPGATWPDIAAGVRNLPSVTPAPTLAEAAKVLLDAWDADDLRVVGPWAEADDINGVQFGRVLRRIAEGGE